MHTSTKPSLESVLEKLSRSLADRFGINLICQGERCCTDGKNIYLPSLPDDIPKELLRAIHGWVDHEVAHICEETDMKAAGEFRERFGSQGFFLLNILEDLRVEEGMRKRFPGSGYNLDHCYEFAIAETAKESVMHPMRQLAFAVNTHANHQPDLPFVSPEIYAAVDMVGAIVEKAATCANTAQVATLAEEAWKILEPLLARQQEQQQISQSQSTSSGDGNNGEGQPQSQEHDPGQTPVSQPSNNRPSGNTPSQSHSEKNGGQHSAKARDKNASGEPKGVSPQQHRDKGQETDTPGANTSLDPGQQANGAADPANGTGDERVRGILGDLGGAIADQVRNYADSHQSYRVWCTGRDRVVLAGNAAYRTHGERMASVMPHVSGVRQRLLQTLLAEPRARWRGDMEKGNVNPRALHRLVCPAAGREEAPRVFRRRERVKKLRTAVTLLVDESNSMNGRKVQLAEKTALVFCEALSRLNIATSVVGFSTARGNANLADACAQTGMPEDAIRSRYRTIPLMHTVYKRFGEQFHKVSGRMDCMRAKSLTPLGESMLFAARELAARPEERKVLFVITDGRPVADITPEDITFSHAKEAIKRIEKAGVDVALLGIMESCVTSLHHRSVVIHRVDDLPHAAMRQLQNVLSR